MSARYGAMAWFFIASLVTTVAAPAWAGWPACTINTYAGTGVSGYGGDGFPALEAALRSPEGVALGPDGSLYIADSVNNRVRKVDPAGIISTFAGTGSYGHSGDGGPATEARLEDPSGVAVGPDGSVYIADGTGDRVRKVDPAGIITTAAGTGVRGYSGDGGPATAAAINRPSGVAVSDDGSLYIADMWNDRIRKVDPAGIITTVAGNGTRGYSGDGGPAVQAALYYPREVAIADDGSFYIADRYNHRIRKVDSAGIITTIAGNGTGGYSGDGGPAVEASLYRPYDVTIADDGSLYIADTMNHRIRGVDLAGTIVTLVGNGEPAYSGDGGLATEASLCYPYSIAVDGDSTLYIADTNNDRIRRVCGEPLPPICVITYAHVDTAAVGEPVDFDSHAADPDGGTVSAAWAFGDGSAATGLTTSHSYNTAGTYAVICTVTDDEGATGTCEIALTIAAAAPVCVFTWSPTSPYMGDEVNFDGSGSSDPDGVIVSWAWSFGGTGPVTSHVFYSAGTLTVSLTVTDNDGAATTCSQSIVVQHNPALHWNCNLQVYWGQLYGSPTCTWSYFGVVPGATDGYDLIDSKVPGPDDAASSGARGYYVFCWFERPAWGVGRLIADWRAPIAEGTSKRWGDSPILDTWNVKTNYNFNDHSGYFHPCDLYQELEYPIAASVYLTWEFGIAEYPPYPLPPEDYSFTLMYRGGINAKPAGTQLPDAMEVPVPNTTWDMEATPYLVIPLWDDYFQPWRPDCMDFYMPDTAKFLIIVDNPDLIPTCGITVDPGGPEEAPATFTFTATATGDEPLTLAWDFGDGASDVGNPVSHTYENAGQYTVACAVTDRNGDTAACTAVVIVGHRPTCNITYTPPDPIEGEVITFSAGATDPDGMVVSVFWDFGDGGTASGDPVTHLYAAPGSVMVTATVCDDDGLCTTCTSQIEWATELSFWLRSNCWHRISFPCHATNPDPWEVFDELRPPNKPLDLLSGCLHRYDHDGRTYVTYWHTAPSQFGPITPGQGYLVWLFGDVTIRYRARCEMLERVSFPTPGWYMMGTPQPTDIYLDDTRWYQDTTGPYSFGEIMNLWVQDPLVGWICEAGRYYNVGLLPWDEDHYLRAFQGYWLYAFEPDLRMEVPLWLADFCWWERFCSSPSPS